MKANDLMIFLEEGQKDMSMVLGTCVRNKTLTQSAGKELVEGINAAKNMLGEVEKGLGNKKPVINTLKFDAKNLPRGMSVRERETKKTVHAKCISKLKTLETTIARFVSKNDADLAFGRIVGQMGQIKPSTAFKSNTAKLHKALKATIKKLEK